MSHDPMPRKVYDALQVVNAWEGGECPSMTTNVLAGRKRWRCKECRHVMTRRIYNDGATMDGGVFVDRCPLSEQGRTYAQGALVRGVLLPLEHSDHGNCVRCRRGFRRAQARGVVMCAACAMDGLWCASGSHEIGGLRCQWCSHLEVIE